VHVAQPQQPYADPIGSQVDMLRWFLASTNRHVALLLLSARTVTQLHAGVSEWVSKGSAAESCGVRLKLRGEWRLINPRPYHGLLPHLHSGRITSRDPLYNQRGFGTSSVSANLFTAIGDMMFTTHSLRVKFMHRGVAMHTPPIM
jgi:hypothetical protein